MTLLSTPEYERLAARHEHLLTQSTWKTYRAPLLATGLIVYFMFCWWFFSIGKVLGSANYSIAGNYLADWVSYEIRPELNIDRDGAITISYSRFDPIGPNPNPDWIKSETATVTRQPVASAQPEAPSASAPAPAPAPAPAVPAFNFMANAPKAEAATSTPTIAKAPVTETAIVKSSIDLGRSAKIVVDHQTVILTRGSETVELKLDNAAGTVTAQALLPTWVEQRMAGGRAYAYFGFAGWAEVSADRVRIHNRFFGWANFFFDINSAFFGKSPGEILTLVTSGPRIDASQSNLSLAWNDILYNPSWQHLDVWSKLLQTLVMAFVGTVLATLLSFPLAFIAARNITRNRPLNQFTKRLFDFLRSVDMLIWALFFTRAFGPGPLAGISAIFFTDTGTLGKLYAEALENLDDKQREGVKSVGASPLAIQRYGVVPQVLPIFASQALYFLESNTRSATIIGAVGAGGIGLKLWEAMRTNSNWENVCYMVLLILLVVFIFDGISNALRSRLIGTARH